MDGNDAIVAALRRARDDRRNDDEHERSDIRIDIDATLTEQ